MPIVQTHPYYKLINLQGTSPQYYIIIVEHMFFLQSVRYQLTFQTFMLPLNTLRKGLGFSQFTQQRRFDSLSQSWVVSLGRQSGIFFSFRLFYPSRFFVYTQATLESGLCCRSRMSQGKYSSLFTFITYPTFIDYHFLFSKPIYVTTYTSLLFYFLSLLCRLQSSRKSFIIETATTVVNGKNMVGFP